MYKEHTVRRFESLLHVHIACSSILVPPPQTTMTVKVHYTTTRAVRVLYSIQFNQLGQIICSKFGQHDGSLTLWYVPSYVVSTTLCLFYISSGRWEAVLSIYTLKVIFAMFRLDAVVDQHLKPYLLLDTLHLGVWEYWLREYSSDASVVCASVICWCILLIAVSRVPGSSPHPLLVFLCS